MRNSQPRPRSNKTRRSHRKTFIESLESRWLLSSTAYNVAPAPLLGLIQAENFDNGGEGSAYHDTTSVNEGGAYRNEGVDVEPSSDAGGGYDVGYIHAGEWMNYTVHAASTGTYDLSLRVADVVQGGTFHVEIDGVNVSGAMTVPNSGGWQKFTTITKTGIAVSAGDHVVKVVADSNGQYGFVGNLNWLQFANSTPTTTTTTATPFNGTPAALPAVIQLANYDKGGEGSAYHDTTPANEGGAYRNDGVDLQTSTDSAASYNVGWTHAGEWLQYTVNSPTASTYNLSVRVADPAQGGTFHVEVDGKDVTGALSASFTAGWQSYTTVTKSGIDISAGDHTVRLVMDSNGAYGFVGNFSTMQFAAAAGTSAPIAVTPTVATPFTGTAAPVPGTIEAENFDNGGEGIAYHSSSTTNYGGAYRSTGVSIQGSTDAGAGYNVGWVHAGDWLSYTVNVATDGTYALDSRVADGGQGGTFHVEFNGTDLTGALAVGSTGGWQSYATVTKFGIALKAGTYQMKVVMDTAGSYGFVGNFNWFKLSAVAPVVTVPVTTPITPPVTDPVPITDPVTTPITTPVTTPITTPVTDPVTTPIVTDPITTPVTDPITTPVTTDPVVTTPVVTTPVVTTPVVTTPVVTPPVTTTPVTTPPVTTTPVTTTPVTPTPVTTAPPVTTTPQPPAALNLLFFGNSFTLYNNLPSLVAQIAAADGHATPNVYLQATYGWTLGDHLNKIAADGSSNIISSSLASGLSWDDVVIQEYSTRPSSVTAAPVYGDPAGFRRDAATLFGKVRANSPSVHGILEETWARGADNPIYPGSYSNPSEMQSDILNQYNYAASDINGAFGAGSATVAHAGEAWRARTWNRSLYDGSDEYHPSVRGSIQAALVVERSIYHDRTSSIPSANVAGMLAAAGLTRADWTQLTAIADSV